MARAVVPRTAAAVDHADTELIGQSGRRISLWCFFIVFSHHIIEGIPRICPILCIYSHFVSLAPCTEILHCAQNDLPRKNTLDSMKKNHTDQVWCHLKNNSFRNCFGCFIIKREIQHSFDRRTKRGAEHHVQPE